MSLIGLVLNINYTIIKNDDESIACFIIITESSIIISFRGTETRNINRQINNIITDTNITKVKFYDFGKIHKGFKFAADSIWNDLYKIVKNNYKNKSIWLTGHSLGGALAVIIGAMLLTLK